MVVPIVGGQVNRVGYVSVAATVASCILLASVALVPNACEEDGYKADLFWVDFMEFALSPSQVYVGEEVTFWANASSNPLTPNLTFTLFFDALLPGDPLPVPNPDSGIAVNVTSNPGSMVQTYTYNAVGNFTNGEYFVRLYVDDGTENRSLTRYVIVRENGPPVFVVSPPAIMYAEKDVPVNMSVCIIDLDDDPVDILWEFGDGATASNSTDGSIEDGYVNQTHAWSPAAIPGLGDYDMEYQVNITAMDPLGNNVTEVMIVCVPIPHNFSPVISMTASTPSAAPDEEVIFYANATDSEGEPLTWTFDYSDGTTEVIHTGWTDPGETVWCNTSHSFNELGFYTVTLHVSDAIDGYQVFPHNVSTSVFVNVAENQMPLVTSNIAVEPYYPIIDVAVGYLEVSLIIQVFDPDGDVLFASWTIEGIAGPLVNVSAGGTSVYQFVQIMNVTEAGSYDVMVVVTDGYEGHEVARSLTVNVTSNNLPPSIVSFIFAYPPGLWFGIVNNTNDFALSFSDPENDAIEVVISFGDGTPDVHVNLTDYDVYGNVSYAFSHVYSYPGEFTVTVNYTDNEIGLLTHEKCSSVDLTIVEDSTAPVADAGENATVQLGEAVFFSGAGSDDDIAIANYTWSFVYDGELMLLYGEAPEFTFWILGVYEVNLEVTDYGGNHNTSTVVISVVEVIPEFSSVLIPVLGIIVAVALFAVMRRRPT